jgi:Coenzyme PQQ synthesis protein D (PqqD)
VSLRLRPDIATTTTDDGLVLLDERSGRYWQLSLTGAGVLRALLAGQEPEQVAQDLVTRYRIDPHQAHQDITALIGQLRSAKLVVAS